MKKIFLFLISVFLLTSCGKNSQSPENAYYNIMINQDAGKIYDSLSSEAKVTMTGLMAMMKAFDTDGEYKGLEGKNLFIKMFDDFPALSSESILSSEINEDGLVTIYVDDKKQDYQMIKEDGKWKLFFTPEWE